MIEIATKRFNLEIGTNDYYFSIVFIVAGRIFGVDFDRYGLPCIYKGEKI